MRCIPTRRYCSSPTLPRHLADNLPLASLLVHEPLYPSLPLPPACLLAYGREKGWVITRIHAHTHTHSLSLSVSYLLPSPLGSL